MLTADSIVTIIFGLVMLALGLAAFWLQWLGRAARVGTFALARHVVSFVEIAYDG